MAGFQVGIGVYLMGIPLHRSPGILPHILILINILTSHSIDREKGV
jgi:hypothetical protein